MTLLALQPVLRSGDIDFGADQILHDLDDFTDGVGVKTKNQERTPNLRN